MKLTKVIKRTETIEVYKVSDGLDLQFIAARNIEEAKDFILEQVFGDNHDMSLSLKDILFGKIKPNYLHYSITTLSESFLKTVKSDKTNAYDFLIKQYQKRELPFCFWDNY